MEDFDRPLNDRGRRGAQAMGAWIADQGLAPDQVISSSAARTRETCALLGLAQAPAFEDRLYHSGPDQMLAHIRRAQCDRLLVVAHNPGIATLAGQLCRAPPDHGRFLDYPTAALTVMRFEITHFSEIGQRGGLVEHFLTPHDLPQS